MNEIQVRTILGQAIDYLKIVKGEDVVPSDLELKEVASIILEHIEEQDKKYHELIKKYEEAIENATFYESETYRLSHQLDYLRSGEYYNQLRFENELLQHVVDTMEISKEDREFIDMTHRNTELLEENQRLKQWDKNKDTRNSRQRVANARLLKENKKLKEELHNCSIEIQRLNEMDLTCPTFCTKLKERDEVIDEIKNTVKKYVTEKETKTNSIKQFEKYMELPIIIQEILQRYKGDNK